LKRLFGFNNFFNFTASIRGMHQRAENEVFEMDDLFEKLNAMG
jgi:hypothetical protein